MTFQGSLIKEQGIEFAIVIVKSHVLSSPNIREEVREDFSRFFPRVPIILMTRDSCGIPKYQVRTDIIKSKCLIF